MRMKNPIKWARSVNEMPTNIFVKVESVEAKIMEAKINMEVLSRLNIFGIMMYLAVQRYLIVIHK